MPTSELSDTDKALVEVFCSRLAAAFDNVTLYERAGARQPASWRRRWRAAPRSSSAAKERLENQSERLKRANAFKSEVLGTVAHDLKNPLGVILGRTEMLNELLAAAELPEKAARDQIEHIRQSARRLTAMVEDLIADARADAVDISVRAYRLDFGLLVAGGRRRATASSPAARTRRCTSTAEPGLRVARRHRAAARGGRQSRQQRGEIQPDRRPDRSHRRRARAARRCVRVADQGPGLSPEDNGRLFGRFQRLSAKPTGGESSTGLGLSIAKRIIDLHKGRIFVESPGPAGGAVFAIALPLLDETDCRMSQQQNIFVVDDEAAARDMIGDYLKMHGFDVTLCDGGKSLRAEVEKAQPGSRRARPQHAGGGRAFADPLPEAIRQRAGHHADRDREPDRPRGRAGARRRRLSRQAGGAARASGARALGAAPQRRRGRRPGGHAEPHGEDGHEMARPRRPRAARRGGQRASADGVGVQPAQGVRREPEAGADARAAARPGAGARFGGLRPRDRRAHHPHPPEDRARPGAPAGHQDGARRGLCVLAGCVAESGELAAPGPFRDRHNASVGNRP